MTCRSANWYSDIMSIRPMTLNSILEGVECVQAALADGDRDVVISSITEDSRKVTDGCAFVALNGEKSDGNDFVDAAIDAGASVIISERALEGLSVPMIQVAHARRALGQIAHALVGDPSKGLIVIGVTGTNGKSSTVTMIRHILEEAGKKVACFGTLGYSIAGVNREAPHTTPFNEDLALLFAEARDAEVTHVVMEVSSHALAQERVSGIDFDIALFTNLTQDHLDYHTDMDDYRNAKLKLFRGLSADEGISIANADDPSFEAFADAGTRTQWSFGKVGEISAEHIELKGSRTEFTLESPWGRARCSLGLVGDHNVSNLLGAVAVCGTQGISIDTIAEAIHSLPPIPGRFESIDCGQPFHVIVDYAHTDDGLRNVLQAARPICSGTLRVVFGCGGDRDKGKRPKMAAVAAELGDYAIVTSDNPRSESPERILMDIEVGLQHAGKKRGDDYDVIESRKEAIETMLSKAEPGDLVMIAGKGHEDYQILADKTIHFDDREIARDWLEKNT
jgi:UDP-N-acetylmuramoyl-L-alanyl-D-glutamate--2,6-diaminopimelate ligase